MKKINKIAGNQIGIGIIIVALLLFVSGIIFNPNVNITDKTNSNNINNNNSDYDKYGYPEPNYLFYLNQTNIGRETKVTQNFANIDLGSKIQYNVIYNGNNFFLNANAFTSNTYTFQVPLNKPENINNLLLYFDQKRDRGNQQLIIKVDGKIISKNLGRDQDIPIKINNIQNRTSINISLQLEKPSWYSIFNWNKYEVSNLKVVEERQNKANNVRDFDFLIDKDNLKHLYVDLSVLCPKDKKIGNAIEILVNGQIISNENIDCVAKYKKLTSNIPITALKNNQINRIEFRTTGFYKMAYSLNKIYYTDQSVYKFKIDSFNNILDVLIHGDFDKDVIDLRINDKQTISLQRKDLVSIIQYLNYGINKIEILTKPVDIKELIIEKNQY